MSELNTLEPITLDFFERAPLRVRSVMIAKCSPEILFETLRGDTVWTEWAGVIKHVKWTSEKPYAKGSTRDVTLTGNMLVREIFFHWEENERVAFYATASTIPGLTRFAEDYIVERIGPTETRLTWTIALENTGFMKYLNPLTRVVMAQVLKRWLGRYRTILEARAAARIEPSVTQSAATSP